MYLRPIGLCSAASTYFVQFYAPVGTTWLSYDWLLPCAVLHWCALLEEEQEMPSKPGHPYCMGAPTGFRETSEQRSLLSTTCHPWAIRALGLRCWWLSQAHA